MRYCVQYLTLLRSYIENNCSRFLSPNVWQRFSHFQAQNKKRFLKRQNMNFWNNEISIFHQIQSTKVTEISERFEKTNMNRGVPSVFAIFSPAETTSQPSSSWKWAKKDLTFRKKFEEKGCAKTFGFVMRTDHSFLSKNDKLQTCSLSCRDEKVKSGTKFNLSSTSKYFFWKWMMASLSHETFVEIIDFEFNLKLKQRSSNFEIIWNINSSHWDISKNNNFQKWENMFWKIISPSLWITRANEEKSLWREELEIVRHDLGSKRWLVRTFRRFFTDSWQWPWGFWRIEIVSFLEFVDLFLSNMKRKLTTNCKKESLLTWVLCCFWHDLLKRQKSSKHLFWNVHFLQKSDFLGLSRKDFDFLNLSRKEAEFKLEKEGFYFFKIFLNKIKACLKIRICWKKTFFMDWCCEPEKEDMGQSIFWNQF